MNSQSLSLSGTITTEASSTAYRWASLPPEICLLILESVLEKCDSKKEPCPDQKASSVAPYATVCRGWQCFFESHTFRRLHVEDSSLCFFTEAMRGKNAARLNYIRYLGLCIELSGYSCVGCSKPEGPMAIARNNQTFTTSLRGLFEALSLWVPNHSGGLTLEISAWSPGDSQHHFREFVDADMHARFQLEEDLQRAPSLLEYSRQKLEEVRPTMITHPRDRRFQVYRRLKGTPLELGPGIAIPQVPIVKTLWLRPHFYRGIAFLTLARMFQDSLVGMESFRFERWTGVTSREEKAFFSDFQKYLVPAFPPSLMRFSFNQWPRWKNSKAALSGEMVDIFVTDAAAASFCRLTELCPPWQVYTMDFLIGLYLSGSRVDEKPKLELLCLECRLLDLSAGQPEFTGLLGMAAMTALCMPKLRTLEIWNAVPGHSFIFRYARSPYKATITWRSIGRGIVLEDEVVKRWADVAAKRRVPLEVEVDPFKEAAGEGKVLDGKLIYRHLELGGLAIDPITLARLEAETALALRY
ncbi:hypothetical protein ACJZ2D_004263 [Fusarium nematophilum]